MSTSISLHHKTFYTYDRPVFLSPHLFRLRPAAHAPAKIERYSLHFEPTDQVTHWQQDVFGNFIARVDFNGPMTGMSVEVNLDATLTAYDPFNVRIDDYAQTFPFQYLPNTRKDLFSYLELVDQGPKLAAFTAMAQNPGQDILGFLVSINQMVYNQIGYLQRMEEGVRTSEQTLDYGTGSCRDSAWMLVQVLRYLGLAARFVSGYLVQLQTVKPSVDLHAWVEVFIPGAGWIGLDTTSGLFTSEGHIPLAATPRTLDAAPVTGTTDPCIATIHYETAVTVN